jgi:hypothetical protein
MIRLKIKGGAGAIPVRFEGLDKAKGWQLGMATSSDGMLDEYLPTLSQFVPSLASRLEPKTERLDQAVHGNDFWETTFDPESKTYTLTYNLPLDGKTESTWFLKKSPYSAQQER